MKNHDMYLELITYIYTDLDNSTTMYMYVQYITIKQHVYMQRCTTIQVRTCVQ